MCDPIVIPFCAKQGVEQKISFEDFLSAMLSDYECAYACGLAARLLNCPVNPEMKLLEIKALVEAAMPKDQGGLNYQIRNLCKLIQDYSFKEGESVPEEISTLIQMGLDEEKYDQYKN